MPNYLSHIHRFLLHAQRDGVIAIRQTLWEIPWARRHESWAWVHLLALAVIHGVSIGYTHYLLNLNKLWILMCWVDWSWADRNLSLPLSLSLPPSLPLPPPFLFPSQSPYTFSSLPLLLPPSLSSLHSSGREKKSFESNQPLAQKNVHQIHPTLNAKVLHQVCAAPISVSGSLIYANTNMIFFARNVAA